MMDPSYVNPRSPSRCTGPSLLRNIGSKKPLVRLMVPADADCEKRTNAKRAKERTSVGRIRRLSAKAARASISEGARLVNLFSLRACPVLRWVDSGSNGQASLSFRRGLIGVPILCSSHDYAMSGGFRALLPLSTTTRPDSVLG